MKIIIKSPREIALIKKAGSILADTFDYLKVHTRAGISTKELDKLAEGFIRNHGGIPTCKGYEGFPGAICISVNDTLLHGIPSKSIILKDGDIVSYDICVTYEGYIADACRTFPVGEISSEAQRLLDTTKKCFFEAVKLVKPGVHLGDISQKIYETGTSAGYTLTRDYGGHGVGREMHEDPFVLNYGEKGTGPILKKGMVIAIEPMLNEGKVELYTLDDGWTVKTLDGKLSCHYENTIAITDDGYEILTLEKGEVY